MPYDGTVVGDIDIYDDLYAASAVGEDDLWVAGYFGAIYRTRDAGETWTKLETPTEKSLYDISFADNRTGWVVGRRADTKRALVKLAVGDSIDIFEV